METIEINGLSDFNLTHILECGQCFRWHKEDDKSYTGITKDGVFNISMPNASSICVKCQSKENLKECIGKYFDLNRNYGNIKKLISTNDANMIEAIKYGYGIRILKQDPWEMLISYMISAANNIPRISKTIENLSKAYGKKIILENKEYYMFPTPEELSRATIEDLRKLNLGFRDKYVYMATQDIVSGKIDLEEIKNLHYVDAKSKLMGISGVGAKVADCILLFSMNKVEAFPVDTWIKKVMVQLYLTNDSIKEISKFAETKFGDYAGIAQQYLFYYMRENK